MKIGTHSSTIVYNSVRKWCILSNYTGMMRTVLLINAQIRAVDNQSDSKILL